MRFDIVATLAALASGAVADRMEVFTECGVGQCSSSNAFFYTDYGSYRVNANTGCRGTGVPGMVEFCVDWDRRRAHFRYGGQGKRCLLQRSETAYGCQYDACWKTTWEEVSCGWKKAAVEEEDVTSITATTAAAVETEEAKS
ncbi:hypothetical protein ACJ41O_005713 [Fusarium nematophilum]